MAQSQIQVRLGFLGFSMALEAMSLEDRPHVLLERQRLSLPGMARNRSGQYPQGQQSMRSCHDDAQYVTQNSNGQNPFYRSFLRSPRHKALRHDRCQMRRPVAAQAQFVGRYSTLGFPE